MTFLELAQKLFRECEVPGSAPSAVTGQTGQQRRLVDWTADAWNDIQNYSEAWRWMRRPFTFNTVASDGSYAPSDVTDVDAGSAIARFGHWWAHDLDDPYLAYLTSEGVAGQYRLIYLPWETFKWLYRFGTQTDSKPIHVSVDHQNNLVLGPKPNGIYTVTGDFQRSLQRMTADGHIPEMPTQFHELIVYWAMEKYGANSVAGEVFARAQLESARLMTALERDQLPQLSLPGPLV